MKKYICIDIKEHLNHKMICSDTFTESIEDECGVMGMVAVDDRYDFLKKRKYLKEGGIEVWGSLAERDNIKCNGQVILFPDVSFSKIVLVGFSEIGSYFDSIQLIDADGEKKEMELEFYHMFENQDMLYDCDSSLCCQRAYSVKTNTMMKMNYYVNVIEVDKEYSGIVLQDNEEIHIAAITLIKS